MTSKPLKPWRYRDFGSLVSLGRHSTVGNLMGGRVGRSLWLEGDLAWLMYVSLYQMHQLGLAWLAEGCARHARPVPLTRNAPAGQDALTP